MEDYLYLGIKGHVVCMNKHDGRQVWKTAIKNSQLTNIVVDEEYIFAYSAGHLFCLSSSDGRVHWKNNLPGLGYGYCIIATKGSQGAVSAASQIEAQTAAVIASGAVASSGNGGS